MITLVSNLFSQLSNIDYPTETCSTWVRFKGIIQLSHLSLRHNKISMISKGVEKLLMKITMIMLYKA
jgi:hypothetical protein